MSECNKTENILLIITKQYYFWLFSCPCDHFKVELTLIIIFQYW